MKRTEIAMIILIAGISMGLTFFVARAFFGDAVKKEATIDVVPPIKKTLDEPSKLIFNERAINPTVEVYVEDEISASFDRSRPAADKKAKDAKAEAEKEQSEQASSIERQR